VINLQQCLNTPVASVRRTSSNTAVAQNSVV